jgi:hypothetical protein
MKDKNKKTLIILGIAILILFVFIIFQQHDSRLPAATYYPLQEENKVTVAGCPTFYYMLDKLSNNEIDVIKTNSTAESLYYLQKGKVDLIISGRNLRPDEPKFSFEIIGPGYSFISEKELLIFDKEMSNYDFFTDLSGKEIMKNFPYIIYDKISEVENVYDYLNAGIIITSVENTDYSKSGIVHVYTEDGSRHSFSRTPIIYYSENVNNLDYIKNILK